MDVYMKKKFCWEAREFKKGWRVGFSYGNAKVKYIDHWFESIADIRIALKGSVVFIHLKNSTNTQDMV